jgi:hypothetical protein
LTWRSLASAALLGAALTLPAGCGENEREAYGEDFRPLSRQIVALGDRVGTAIAQADERTDAQIEREFGALADELGRLGREVEGLDAPDELAGTEEKLLVAMNEAERGLRGIERAAEAGDADAARQSTIELLQASEDLRSSRRKLARESR